MMMTQKPDPSAEYLERLFDAEQISPTLRRSYQAELDAMLRPTLTPRKALLGTVLLIILLAFTAGLVRNMFVYEAKPLVLTAWTVLAVAFLCASFLIARDLWRRKHTPKAVFSIAQILTGAAGGITVLSLMLGLSQPGDPASTFSAFYVFVFYFACTSWNLENRIAAAELAAREQMLRIECRLADLAERLER